MPLLRVAIYGSECTGKTTLTHQLAEHFQCPCAEEFVREFYDRKGYTPENADLDPIARGQIANEDAATQSATDLVFFDASLLNHIVYAHHYYGRCPDWVEEEISAKRRQCDLYLLCDIDLPWESDAQRDRSDRRGEMHALFIEALVTRGLRFRLVSGSGEERLRCAREAVESFLGSN